MSKEIATYFSDAKRESIRSIKSKSGGVDLWKVVRQAKDQSPETIPMDLTVGGILIPPGSRAESFAKFFMEKIKLNAENTVIYVNVYNGKNKLTWSDHIANCISKSKKPFLDSGYSKSTLVKLK